MCNPPVGGLTVKGIAECFCVPWNLLGNNKWAGSPQGRPATLNGAEFGNPEETVYFKKGNSPVFFKLVKIKVRENSPFLSPAAVGIHLMTLWHYVITFPIH